MPYSVLIFIGVVQLVCGYVAMRSAEASRRMPGIIASGIIMFTGLWLFVTGGMLMYLTGS